MAEGKSLLAGGGSLFFTQTEHGLVFFPGERRSVVSDTCLGAVTSLRGGWTKMVHMVKTTILVEMTFFSNFGKRDIKMDQNGPFWGASLNRLAATEHHFACRVVSN